MTKIRVTALLLAAMLLCGLTACGEDSSTADGESASKTVYTKEAYGFQTERPQSGDVVAIMHTSMGDIAIRLFPKAAPKAVKNFTTHAKNGYYDGLTFHRVMQDFMIQGGDPDGNGTGGESIWGAAFEDEFDAKLLNIRGALSMANSGVNTNGSQFFINQAGPNGTAAELKAQYDLEAVYQQYIQMYGKEQVAAIYPTADSLIEEMLSQGTPDWRLIPDEVWALYAKHGGNLHLDGAWRQSGGHTVFGQVYEGMDVVDAIAAVKTDGNDMPVTPVTITSIDIKTY